MTVVLELKPEIEEALKKKANAKGSPLNTYVEELIQKDVDPGPSIDEILAPVRKEFEESRMTEGELNEFIDDLREKVWQERKRG